MTLSISTRSASAGTSELVADSIPPSTTPGSSAYGPVITAFMTDATSQRARRLTFATARPTMSRMDRYRLGEISRSTPM